MSRESGTTSEVGANLDFAAAQSNKRRASSGGRAWTALFVVWIGCAAKEVRDSFETKKADGDGGFYVNNGTGVLKETNDGGGGCRRIADITRESNGGVAAGDIYGI